MNILSIDFSYSVEITHNLLKNVEKERSACYNSRKRGIKMRKINNLKGKILLTAGYCGLLAVFWAFKLPCVYRYLFNIACPGCGMSRAFFSLMRLDLRAAFSYHRMFWSVPILYLYFLFDATLFKNKVLNYIVLSLIILGFIINWLVQIC